ncbi:MAG: hypothetical protein ABI114_06250 [Rhodanobacter sp.]
MTLRAALMVLGLLMLAAAPALLLFGQIVPAIWLVSWGVVLTAGVAYERWRYKSNLAQPPGAAYKPTGERFIDPGTGQLVEVYYDQATGKRSYVDISSK